MIKTKKAYNCSDFGRSRVKIKPTNITYNISNLLLNTAKVKISGFDLKKRIILPTELTPLLAEEIGIHLGDGFMSEKRNDFRVKGHKTNEKYYYLDYIKYIYKYLYNINLNIKNYKDTIGFEIYSKALCQFKRQILGIMAGSKDDLSLPEIIKVNNEEILCRFLRGFFDTDGHVAFITRYGRKNYYPTIGIEQKSRNIINEVAEILSMLGFNPKVYNYDFRNVIKLHGYSQLRLFEEKIGWSNPKHLKKVKQWKELFNGGHSLEPDLW